MLCAIIIDILYKYNNQQNIYRTLKRKFKKYLIYTNRVYIRKNSMKNNNIIQIDPFGFREYDARWLYPKGINLKGIENLGLGLGTQIINKTKKIQE